MERFSARQGAHAARLAGIIIDDIQFQAGLGALVHGFLAAQQPVLPTGHGMEPLVSGRDDLVEVKRQNIIFKGQLLPSGQLAAGGIGQAGQHQAHLFLIFKRTALAGQVLQQPLVGVAAAVDGVIGLGLRSVCGVGFLVLASPLMVLLYNDASKTPAYLLMLGSVVVVLYGWSSISNSILHGLNHISSPAKNACIALVVHLAAFVVMMTAFKMNVYALAAGNIVFAACMCWLNQRKVHKVCGFRMNIMDTFIKPLIASAVMGIVTYAAHLALDLLIGGRWIPTIIAIFIAMIVYVVVVLKIGTLSDEDIEALPMGARLLRLCRRLHLMP